MHHSLEDLDYKIMADFHNTMMGKKYYEHDLPKLIESQNRLAAAIEKQNQLNEKLQRLERSKLKESSNK
jgi:hypothetical protein